MLLRLRLIRLTLFGCISVLYVTGRGSRVLAVVNNRYRVRVRHAACRSVDAVQGLNDEGLKQLILFG